MKDKYLSIITNFGCHYTCPYCLVKNNNIIIPPTTIGSLDKLIDKIIENEINVVSVGGGGDPLHLYCNHVSYYRRLFNILNELKIPLEMHTSYINTMFPIERCGRVVYHIRSLSQLEEIKRYAKEIVRVVFVVTEDFSEGMIDRIADEVKHNSNIDELSFRQMVGNNYQTTHYCEEYLRLGHKKDWWYIEQCDFNLYYVEGNIYTEYSKIGVSHEA